jgi:hypothetical protein
MKSPRLTLLLTGGLFLGFIASASAQGWYIVEPGFTANNVLAGGTSVWTAAPRGAQYTQLYSLNPSTQMFNPAGIYSAIFATGGGDVLQPDETWAVDYSGYIYRYVTSSQSWSCCWYNPSVADIEVGPGYTDDCHPYEVWVLPTSSSGNLTTRYNFCTSAFDNIAATVGFTNISVGGGEVWALNTSHQIFRFDPSSTSFVQMPGFLTSIAVGADGVWGLYGNTIYEFNPAIQNWDWVPGSLAAISAGGDGFWGINSNRQIYRYQASTRSFVLVPNDLSTQISVGAGAGVWAEESSTGNVMTYAFAHLSGY